VTPLSPIDGNLQNHIWYSINYNRNFLFVLYIKSINVYIINKKKQKTINFARVVPHRFMLLSY